MVEQKLRTNLNSAALKKIKVHFEKILEACRHEHGRFAAIVSDLDIEANTQESIKKNKETALNILKEKRGKLKDPNSSESTTLKRMILYKSGELQRMAKNLLSASSPLTSSARAHEIGNNLELLKKELSCFERQFPSIRGELLCQAARGSCKKIEKELSETRNFLLERSLVGYFSSPEEFSYPMTTCSAKGLFTTKQQHENSIVSHASHLFQVLNTTNDLPYYVNRIIDTSVERVLQNELLSIINNEAGKSVEEKYKQFNEFSKKVFKKCKENFEECRQIFYDLHGNYIAIYRKLEELKKPHTEADAALTSKRLLKELFELYNEYGKKLDKFRRLEEPGLLSTLVKDMDFLLNGNEKLPFIFETASDNLHKFRELFEGRKAILPSQLSKLIASAKETRRRQEKELNSMPILQFLLQTKSESALSRAGSLCLIQVKRARV